MNEIELLPTASKLCVKCNSEQALDEFERNRTYKSGFSNTCRSCSRAQRRERYKRNSSKTPPVVKTCGICRIEKPGTEFGSSCSSDGRATYCYDCKSIQSKIRLYGITRQKFVQLAFNQLGACAICNRRPDRVSELHVDHDHDCCQQGSSCGSCIRGLLCSSCNVLLLPGYERLPADLKTWQPANDYLNKGWTQWS